MFQCFAPFSIFWSYIYLSQILGVFQADGIAAFSLYQGNKIFDCINWSPYVHMKAVYFNRFIFLPFPEKKTIKPEVFIIKFYI